MKKLILALTILILPMALIGCSGSGQTNIEQTSITTETKIYTKETNGRFAFTSYVNKTYDLTKYEIMGDVVWLYATDGTVYCTSINNVIIYE